MAKGWIKLHRGLSTHWIWEEETFSKGQAWVDLLLHANHKPTKIMIKNTVLKLNSGDQARSELTLSNNWRWSRGKVRRFLKMLKTEHMIVQRTTQQTSIISICNFEKYQILDGDDGTTGDTANGTTGGTPAVQQADIGRTSDGTQRKNVKNEKNVKNIPSEFSEGVDSETLNKKQSKYKFEPEHQALADAMATPVQQRFPTQKINIEEWADTIRKLLEIDRYTPSQINELWDWIQNHQRGNFSWADNCRTPMKLRQSKDGLKYFEIIKNQMQREVNTHANSQGYYRESTAERVYREAEQVLSELQDDNPGNGSMDSNVSTVR